MPETVHLPIVQIQNSDRIKTSNGSTLRLYAGAVPFLWTLEVYLEEEITESAICWFVTLHILAYGAHQQVFRSSTVELVPDQVIAVPFPFSGNLASAVSGSYGVGECTAESMNGTLTIPASIGVRLSAPHNASPFVDIVDTEVDTSWLIGARHIVLTDPPLRSNS